MNIRGLFEYREMCKVLLCLVMCFIFYFSLLYYVEIIVFL